MKTFVRRASGASNFRLLSWKRERASERVHLCFPFSVYATISLSCLRILVAGEERGWAASSELWRKYDAGASSADKRSGRNSSGRIIVIVTTRKATFNSAYTGGLAAAGGGIYLALRAARRGSRRVLQRNAIKMSARASQGLLEEPESLARNPAFLHFSLYYISATLKSPYLQN